MKSQIPGILTAIADIGKSPPVTRAVDRPKITRQDCSKSKVFSQ